VEKALKRLEGLSKQVQQMARDAASRGSAGPTQRATTTKRTPKTTSRRKPATRKTSAGAAPKKAPRRAPARRTTASAAPTPAESSAPTEST
jgi:hypothetical protein